MSKIAIVTDSASMLLPALAAQHGVIIAPLTIVLDGKEYAEGIDLSAAELYQQLGAGATVSTSQPSPGRIVECYEQAARQGATAILSVHIGAGISGTVQSAQVAAGQSPVPVTIVDTGQASFAEGLCVLEAVDAVAGGASVEDAAAVAKAAGAATGNTFIVKALDLARQGGRLREGGDAAGVPAAGVPVLALQPDGIKVAGSATTLDEAVAIMAAHIEAAANAAGADGKTLRIGIGNGAADAIASALRARVEAMAHIGEIIDYVVGPSMGAHLGPGNAGAVFIARPLDAAATA